MADTCKFQFGEKSVKAVRAQERTFTKSNFRLCFARGVGVRTLLTDSTLAPPTAPYDLRCAFEFVRAWSGWSSGLKSQPRGFEFEVEIVRVSGEGYSMLRNSAYGP